MIERLTKKQEEELIEFREEWRKIGLSTERIDKKSTKGAIIEMYKLLGKQEPKFIFVPSPFFANLQINFCSKIVFPKIKEKIGANLGANLRDKKIPKELQEYQYPHFWGQMDSSWIAFYKFSEIKLGIRYTKDKSELLELWAKIAKSSCWWWAFENYVFVSDRPTKLNFDSNYRLHSEHASAYEFSDGWSAYYLHGVKFEKELWQKIVRREMPMEEVLKIEDIDQRTQAIKFAKTGLREFYLSQGGKKIDETNKFDIKGRIVHYELWEIPKGEIFTKTVHFVIYDCPSSIARGEKQEYSKGVPPFKSVCDALAWGMSNDDNPMTGKEWEKLKPLLDES